MSVCTSVGSVVVIFLNDFVTRNISSAFFSALHVQLCAIVEWVRISLPVHERFELPCYPEEEWDSDSVIN